MLRQLLPQLDVELNEAEHGNRHAGRLENFHPDVRESRAEAVLAVDVIELRNDGHDAEQHAHEAVLEDAEPYYLSRFVSKSTSSSDVGRELTLNHVNPLLGFRKGPLFSFPLVNHCKPKTPQNQFLIGFRVRK